MPQQDAVASLPEQVRGWLTSWAWGARTAADVVRDAYRAFQDVGRVAAHPLVRRLARGHANLGNSERLLESFVPDVGAPSCARGGQLDRVGVTTRCFAVVAGDQITSAF